MKKHMLLKSGAATAVIALTLSVPAFAQDADSATDSVAEAEESGGAIIVTGSRLNANPNIEGASPILSVSQDQIRAQGTVRIEDLVNQLPQVFAGQAGEVSNGSTGTSTLDLRGLGAERTLVLIDGRRLPYGSSSTSAPNIDLIPTQLIERVDVLTGGASAVYGSDAVAGVANFVLRRDFEGVELDVQGGFQQHGNDIGFFQNVLEGASQPVPGPVTDGAEYTFTAIIGTNTADDRGNVTLFANYERREAVIQANRAFSACTLGPSGAATAFQGVGCVGSGNFRLFSNNQGLRPSLVLDADGDPINAVFQQADGTIVPFVGGPAQTFNFGAQNFFQRPSERFSIYAKGHYELSDNVELFADVSYVDNISDAQIAASASFGAFDINCDNPFLQNSPGLNLAAIYGCTAQDIADGTVIPFATASHRNVEGGPRNSRLENSAFRLVGGLRGDFGDSVWNYEIFGQYSETSDTSVSSNDFITANVQQAFLAVDDGTGNVVCIDPSSGCVPYNPFQRNADGSSRITQDQLDFIQGVGIVIGETTQLIGGATLQADLGEYNVKSPFSDEGIAFLVGVEYREDTLRSIPDEISQTPGGGFTGVGGATLAVEGSIEVYEIFGELQVPLVTDRPFFDELTLSGQYRFSDYSTDGNGTTGGFSTDAFGIQLVWAPVEDIKLRGQFQRAVRAPNVIELFTGQNTNLPNLNSAGTNANGVALFDPCASNAPIATFEQCARTGVTAAQFGNILDVIAGQTQSITGGNPELNPESSDTYTFGVVIEPRFIPGLQVTVDYFDIVVDDFINNGIAAQISLDNCLATGDPTFCNLITRGPGGTLASGFSGTGFQQTNINIAELSTSGIDAQVTYNTTLGDLGNLSFLYAATFLDTFDFTPFPGADVVECAGFSDNSCLNPVNSEYRHRASLIWKSNFNLDTTLTWRHFSSVSAFEGAAAIPEQIDNNLQAVNYLDLAFVYGVTDEVTVRFGVNNLLNQNPPISTAGGPPLGNGNTFPTIYDTGRQFFGGLNFRF